MKNSNNGVLFSTTVGACHVIMMLDLRNRKRIKPDSHGVIRLPLCMRFVIKERLYYRLGENYSYNEIAKIVSSTGQGERLSNRERDYDKKKRLKETFDHYVSIIKELDATGTLTLSRIKTALTGQSLDTSFISLWKDLVDEKRNAGKAGTSGNYGCALASFIEITGFKEENGFCVDEQLIRKWADGMAEKGLSSSTQGIYLRAARVVVNKAIAAGHMMQKSYMFGKKRQGIRIPVGNSRKSQFLTVPQMTELYSHWLAKDLDLPIYDVHMNMKGHPSYAVLDEASRATVYQSLGVFLMQYLCCGCNLMDIAFLIYDKFYFDTGRKALRFIRKKTMDETSDGNGIEVIIPIIPPLRNILDEIASPPQMDKRVLPFLLKGVNISNGTAVRNRVHQENHNVIERMRKVALSLGWSVMPTGTYARHSFATNLHTSKVPLEYISDAMGHSLGNTGNITLRYISPYTIEERGKYNSCLLDTNETDNTLSKKEILMQKLGEYDKDELKAALLFLRQRELDKI